MLAIAAFCVATQPAGERRREALRWVVQISAACVLAHLVLIAGTLAVTGELPDWGWYLNTLRAFLFGQLGDWTYDFSRFSPGFAVGALYLASAAALSLIVIRRADLVPRQRPLLVAITGMTAWGIALLSYIVNRGADHIIPYVCLPAVALGALWLALVLCPDLEVSRVGRRASLAMALALSALLVAVAWSSVETRYSQSVLAHAVPGGTSLRTALDRVWNPPALRPEAPVGEQLLDQYMPGEARSIVLTSADLSVEILMRAGARQLGAAWGSLGGQLRPRAAPRSARGVRRPPRGGRPDAHRWARAGGLRRLPGTAVARPPGWTPAPSRSSRPTSPALQEWVLREIGERFDLRTLVRTEEGLEVVELVPLGTSG